MEYYEKRANEYGYSDDPVRFGLLQRGVLAWLKENFQSKKRNPQNNVFCPDIIHCNDWQAGLISNYLKTIYKDDPDLSRLVTVFTIHNLVFQAQFDPRFVNELDRDDGRSEIPDLFSQRFTKLNSMRRAILYSDIINTVSNKYSKEILTREYGCGLDELLQEVRTRLFGIINGIDYDDFNPKTDKLVVNNYDANSCERRNQNKRELQSEFNLPVDETIPILSMSYRLEEQKGIGLVKEVLEYLLREYKVQVVVNGDGDPQYKTYMKELYEKYPEQVGLNLNANFTLPRHIFSGSDLILLPSKFEPCGMVQMEAMRYGCVPIARSVGGLADTIIDNMTGFTFKEFNSLAFFGTVVRALEAYKDKKRWMEIVKNCMKADFSWTNSAKKYEELYYRVLDLRLQQEDAKTHPI
jgi:starch synthase